MELCEDLLQLQLLLCLDLDLELSNHVTTHNVATTNNRQHNSMHAIYQQQAKCLCCVPKRTQCVFNHATYR
jgi:hypothetical protein